MDKEKNESPLIEKLSECSKYLSEANKQIQTLYDIIRKVKDQKERQELIYVYKQTYDEFGKHARAFNSLIRVVEEQENNAQHPKEK